jgi:hypothetical protein
MRSRHSGQGKLGCILWLALVAVTGMVAYKMIPIKVRSSELHDYMVEQAKWAANNTTDVLEKSILARAKELSLPLTEEGVTVEKVRERIKMEAVFTVPVEFPGYTYNWTFHFMVDRPIFIV